MSNIAAQSMIRYWFVCTKNPNIGLRGVDQKMYWNWNTVMEKGKQHFAKCEDKSQKSPKKHRISVQ